VTSKRFPPLPCKFAYLPLQIGGSKPEHNRVFDFSAKNVHTHLLGWVGKEYGLQKECQERLEKIFQKFSKGMLCFLESGLFSVVYSFQFGMVDGGFKPLPALCLTRDEEKNTDNINLLVFPLILSIILSLSY
jgi:hypothetical protein